VTIRQFTQLAHRCGARIPALQECCIAPGGLVSSDPRHFAASRTSPPGTLTGSADQWTSVESRYDPIDLSATQSDRCRGGGRVQEQDCRIVQERPGDADPRRCRRSRPESGSWEARDKKAELASYTYKG